MSRSDTDRQLQASLRRTLTPWMSLSLLILQFTQSPVGLSYSFQFASSLMFYKLLSQRWEAIMTVTLIIVYFLKVSYCIKFHV